MTPPTTTDDPVANIAHSLAALRHQDPAAHARIRSIAFSELTSSQDVLTPATSQQPTLQTKKSHTALDVAEAENWRVERWYAPFLFWRGYKPHATRRGLGAASGSAMDLDGDGEVSALDVFSHIAAVAFVALFVISMVAIVFTTMAFIDAHRSKSHSVEEGEIPDEEFVLPVLTICPTYGNVPSYAFEYTFTKGLHADIDAARDVEFFWTPGADQCAFVDTNSPIARFNPAVDTPRLSDQDYADTLYNSTAQCRWCARIGHKTNITADKSVPLIPDLYPTIRVHLNKTFFDARLVLDWYSLFVQPQDTVDPNNLDPEIQRPSVGTTVPALFYEYWTGYGYRYEREVIRISRTVSEFHRTEYRTEVVHLQLNEEQGVPESERPVRDFLLSYGFSSLYEFRITEGAGYSPWEFLNDIMGFVSLFCGLTLFHLVVYPVFHCFSWTRARQLRRSAGATEEKDEEAGRQLSGNTGTESGTGTGESAEVQ